MSDAIATTHATVIYSAFRGAGLFGLGYLRVALSAAAKRAIPVRGAADSLAFGGGPLCAGRRRLSTPGHRHFHPTAAADECARMAVVQTHAARLVLPPPAGAALRQRLGHRFGHRFRHRADPIVLSDAMARAKGHR